MERPPTLLPPLKRPSYGRQPEIRELNPFRHTSRTRPFQTFSQPSFPLSSPFLHIPGPTPCPSIHPTSPPGAHRPINEYAQLPLPTYTTWCLLLNNREDLEFIATASKTA